MLQMIRTCWTVSVVAAVFAVAYFLLNGTAMGARLCLHSTIEKHAGVDWLEWLDYQGPTRSGEGYVATLHPLARNLQRDAPGDWSPKLRDWWEEARTPNDTLTVSLKFGDVWLGNPGSIPDHSYGLAFGTSPTQVAIGCGVLILILLSLTAILGKRLDADSKEQQYHRPGSLIDRHTQKYK